MKIQEIIRTVEITIVPRSENYVLGVMNLRGKVIPVIDLRIRFNLDKVDFDKSTRIIVVRFEKENIGFVVDEVTQVIRISKSMVEPTPPLVGVVGQEYILGICKYKERLIILLDIDRVVGEDSDSSLRQRFLGAKDKKKSAQEHKEQDVFNKAAAVAEPVKKFSMADEADAVSRPTITTTSAEEDINEVLEDVAKQSNKFNGSEARVEQGELDSLIAKELSKREAETEELNKRKKAAAGADLESALSIDELIAMELTKREAETDELNKKRRIEQDDAEKKNDIVVGISPEVPSALPIVEGSASTNSGESSRSNNETAQLEDLKDITRKIIANEAGGLDVSVKGEMAELIRLLMSVKSRVDVIPSTVLSSQQEIPRVTTSLTDINKTTEQAAFNLLENAKAMSDFYRSLQGNVEAMQKAIEAKDNAEFEKHKNETGARIEQADNLGFHILEALEFQDITEQKIKKIIRAVEEMGARLAALVGFMKPSLNSVEDKKSYDSLLSDLGFA